MGDATARQYVGAIGYHPYGGVYNDTTQILATSGAGKPDAGMITVRNQLRDLAAQYGVQTWMTEVSGGAASKDFDTFRGRAIHIHDEMEYANASAYWGMYTFYGTTGGEGSVVIYDTNSGAVTVAPVGRAIGHYARWVKKGAARVKATSSDPLVQVTAFDDVANKRFTLVIINNDSSPKTVGVDLSGLSIAPSISGEQSTEGGGYWQNVALSGGSTAFSATIPALSVTSLAAATQ
jgi:O-glycosyl hydrolase